MDKEKICRRAKNEDLPELIQLSKGIYTDTDYLPHVYNAWLDWEKKGLQNASIKNLVLVLKTTGRVIGFQSLWIQETDSALGMALRIDPEFRGKGLAKMFINMANDVLKEVNRNMITMKCLVHPAIPMATIKTSGRVFYKESFGCFVAQKKHLEMFYNAPKITSTLEIMSKGEFIEWLQNEASSGRYNETFLYLEHVPHRLACLQNIPIYDTELNFLVSNPSPGGSSEFSISTCPFPVTTGYKMFISIYTDDLAIARDHYKQQMSFLAKKIKSAGTVDSQFHLRLLIKHSIGQKLLKDIMETDKFETPYVYTYTEDGSFATAYFVEEAL